MGRAYGASDNASMESFFSLLQKNVLDIRRWDTREDLRLTIVTWIETKYNRRRRQRALGKLTPVVFVSHRFTLATIVDAYDTFGRAAETKALKVAITRG